MFLKNEEIITLTEYAKAYVNDVFYDLGMKELMVDGLEHWVAASMMELALDPSTFSLLIPRIPHQKLINDVISDTKVYRESRDTAIGFHYLFDTFDTNCLLAGYLTNELMKNDIICSLDSFLESLMNKNVDKGLI